MAKKHKRKYKTPEGNLMTLEEIGDMTILKWKYRWNRLKEKLFGGEDEQKNKRKDGKKDKRKN